MAYKNKLCGIYKITNEVNNKVYIGASLDIRNRWKGHRHGLRNDLHNNLGLQKDWNMYQENNFNFQVIEQCEPENLSKREVDCILQVPEINRYNLKIGLKHSQISKNKTRASTLNNNNIGMNAPNHKEINDKQINSIVELYESKSPMTNISKITGIGISIIRRELLIKGIKIREHNLGNKKLQIK